MGVRVPLKLAQMIGDSPSGIQAGPGADHAEKEAGHHSDACAGPPADAADDAGAHKAEQLLHQQIRVRKVRLLPLTDPGPRQAIDGGGAAHPRRGTKLASKEERAVTVDPNG
jgi:hypothetical protein